jgi:predicted metal-binding membrane protein
MESATIRRAPPLPGRTQLGVVGLLVVLAAVAWAISNDRMSGMDAGPGTDPGTLGFFAGVWVVMMAAMMLPSVAPMVVMEARLEQGRSQEHRGPVWATAFFVGGYLLTWTAAGLVGYGIYQLGREVTGDAFSWSNAGPYLAGGIVLAAAAYQLTPLKDACLRHCRRPFSLTEHWRPGPLGGLRLGVIHGGWCVGCSWALMAALFAFGVMGLGWMALIAALIATEKLLSWKTLANRGIAILLLVLGLSVAFAPQSVPGLVLPDSPQAMRAMQKMGSMSSGAMKGSMGRGGAMKGSMGSGGAMGAMDPMR